MIHEGSKSIYCLHVSHLGACISSEIYDLPSIPSMNKIKGSMCLT